MISCCNTSFFFPSSILLSSLLTLSFSKVFMFIVVSFFTEAFYLFVRLHHICNLCKWKLDWWDGQIFFFRLSSFNPGHHFLSHLTSSPSIVFLFELIPKLEYLINTLYLYQIDLSWHSDISVLLKWNPTSQEAFNYHSCCFWVIWPSQHRVLGNPISVYNF